MNAPHLRGVTLFQDNLAVVPNLGSSDPTIPRSNILGVVTKAVLRIQLTRVGRSLTVLHTLIKRGFGRSQKPSQTRV